jgi:hypothetical protein
MSFGKLIRTLSLGAALVAPFAFVACDDGSDTDDMDASMGGAMSDASVDMGGTGGTGGVPDAGEMDTGDDMDASVDAGDETDAGDSDAGTDAL